MVVFASILFHTVFDLKVAGIYVQSCLTRVLILCKLDLGYNVTEAAKKFVVQRVNA